MRYKIQVSVISLYMAFALTACGQSEASPASDNTAQSYQNRINASEIAPATVQSELTKIVFLGDSLTAGFGLPQEQAWPEQVQKRLKAAG